MADLTPSPQPQPDYKERRKHDNTPSPPNPRNAVSFVFSILGVLAVIIAYAMTPVIPQYTEIYVYGSAGSVAVSVFINILALILGVNGLRKSPKDDTWNGLGISGLVLGIVVITASVITGFIMLILLFNML